MGNVESCPSYLFSFCSYPKKRNILQGQALSILCGLSPNALCVEVMVYTSSAMKSGLEYDGSDFFSAFTHN